MMQNACTSRSHWPRGLRRTSAAELLLGSWVRIPPGHGCLSCTVFVLSGRGLCDGPIPRPEDSYRLWCVSECDQVKIKTLYTYCEKVGRRGRDYETKRLYWPCKMCALFTQHGIANELGKSCCPNPNKRDTITQERPNAVIHEHSAQSHSLSKCHEVSRYAGKCNLIYAKK
jgi:hypothetical protein